MSTRRRSTLWLAAGIGMVLPATLVLVVIHLAPDRERAARSADPGHPPHHAGGSCPSDEDRRVPASAPPGVSWRLLPNDQAPIRLPYSHRYGPCTVTDTTATGYAHTPNGALLAAAQILARASIIGPIGIDTVKEQIVPGTWRDQMVEELRDAAESPPASDGSGDEVSYAAYSIGSTTGDTTRVSLAATTPAVPGTYLVYQVDMTWLRGDWRMQPPPLGDWRAAASEQAELPDGYTAWGPR